MNGFRVRMFLAAAGGGGGGGAAAAGAAASASAAPATGGAPAEAPASAGKPGAHAGLTGGDQAAIAAMQVESGSLPAGWIAAEAKPDWVDARFYDGEKKAVRVPDIAKSWAEADKALKTKTEDLKSQVKTEFEAERNKARPETKEKYVAQLPKDLKMPEGVNYTPDENNPMLQWWRETAHSSGMSQEQFEHGIAAYMKSQEYGAPDIEGEMKKLGEKGPIRVKNVETWLKAKLGEKHWGAIAPFGTSAAAIEAMEAVMALVSAPNMDNGNRAPVSIKSESELKAMMADPRYRDPFKRDQNFVNEVREGFRRLYPQ